MLNANTNMDAGAPAVPPTQDNAPVKRLGLIQRAGFTLITKGVVADTDTSGNARRTPIDDDPRRHDETAALAFMALYPNNRETFPHYGHAPENEKYKDVLRVLAALWTALGPNREEHRGRLFDWLMNVPDNTEERFEANLEKFDREGTSVCADFLCSGAFPKMQAFADARREKHMREAFERAQTVFADDVPPGYMDDTPRLVPGISRRLRILTLDQIENQTVSNEPLDFVEELLDEGATSSWYGEPNSGKSFILLDLGLHVSVGWPWHGRAVDRGGVIYMAGEGSRRFMRRVMAWRKHHGEEKTADALFALIPDMINFRVEASVNSDLLMSLLSSRLFTKFEMTPVRR